ncbi:putative trans-sialidase, Group V, partial [Trypanosoma cruzi]
MNGEVFAVAETWCEKDSVIFPCIASQFMKLDDKNPKALEAAEVKKEVLEECPTDGWNCASKTEDKDDSQGGTRVHVSRPTTVVKGNDICMLAGVYMSKGLPNCQVGVAGVAQWGLLLVKGNVSGVDESTKRIYWNDTISILCNVIGENDDTLTGHIGGGGSGVKMEDGTLVFAMEAVKENNVNGTAEGGRNNNVSLLVYSSDAANWTLSKGISDDGCSDPSVVGWKNKKLMMMTACADGRRRVYEIGDKGKPWTEALGTLSRVWGNNRKLHEKGVRSGFITATIENRDVMLVTLPVCSEKLEKGGAQKGELHLWLTDNTHIVDIGPVPGEGDDAAASSLLYKSGKSGETNNNEELIALYEKKKGDEGKPSPGMVSVRLSEQLKRVKEVVATWNKVDQSVSQLCPSSAEKDRSTENDCSGVKITDGLVGFLSGNFSGNTWRDEYLGVNATVNNNEGAAKATLHAGGVTFKGAWAEWPVGSQGENQLYHFANYNFTLVATVSIHKVPTKEDTPIPLMGVKTNDAENAVLLGLSYNKEKRWKLLQGGGKTEELSGTWETDAKYQVAIVLQNGKQGSIYVNGKLVCKDAQCELKNTDINVVSHFCIGGDGDKTGSKEGVSVTVTNVLLYNRPLDGNEINALNANKASIPNNVAARTSSPVVSRPKCSAEHLAAGATGGVAARDSGAHGDGGTVFGNEVLPSLVLLLGLWGVCGSV